jgi:hypothetical protein
MNLVKEFGCLCCNDTGFLKADECGVFTSFVQVYIIILLIVVKTPLSKLTSHRNPSSFHLVLPDMEHHHLFYSDYEPDYHSNQLDSIYRRWTVEGKDKLVCTNGSARLIDVPEDQGTVAAVLLSEPLAGKIQKALCIAHSYWTSPEKIAAEEKTRFENEAKTQSWKDELEYQIKSTKKKMRRTGGATREQRVELVKLLEERMKCQKTQEWNQRQRQTHEDTVKLAKERWSNAWFAVQQELDRLWVLAGRVNESRHGQTYARSASVSIDGELQCHSTSRSPRRRNCDQNQRLEARSRSANHRSHAHGRGCTRSHHSASRPRSRSQNSRVRDRRREPSAHVHRQARSSRRDRGRSRSRSQSFSRWSDDRRYRDMTVSPARSAASGAELNRLADSMCDTSKILQGFLDVTKPAQYLPITGGNRDEDVEVVSFGVAPSASIADCIGQLDSAVTIDDSGASTAGKAFPDIAPISQQAQEFQDGLRKLALQYDSGNTQPQQFPEAHSCHPNGSKRKRIDRTLSERKLQKMSPWIASDSRTSTLEHTAVGCVQGESGMQRVAGQTPGSSRLSIRDFFKPGCGTGESLNMSTLDR